MKHIKVRTWVKIIFLLIIVFGSTFMYAKYVEPKMYITKEYNIIDSNIPSSFYGIKIVQISDINYKFGNDKDDLNKIVKEINRIKPDIVILSGDLFSNKAKYTDEDFKDITDILKSIKYNLGKFAIKGENDTLDKWNTIIEDSDFIDLNDSYELIYNESIEPILLVGISSNYNNNHISDTIEKIYSEINTEYNFSILVLHEPDFISSIDYSNFNLILAGHSLNGIIKIPYLGGIIKEKYSQIYYNDYYELNNTKLYISSGIGNKNHKFRLFNPPSISLYRLRNK